MTKQWFSEVTVKQLTSLTTPYYMPLPLVNNIYAGNLCRKLTSDIKKETRVLQDSNLLNLQT